MILTGNVLEFVDHFFMNGDNICLFPDRRKCTNYNTESEDKFWKFTNGRTAYFYHANTYHIKTVDLIKVQFIILSISLLVKSINGSTCSVQPLKTDGSFLVFSTSAHWLAKKWLKISTFHLKSIMNLFLWKIGGMSGFLSLFIKVFKIGQYDLGVVLGSINVLVIQE